MRVVAALLLFVSAVVQLLLGGSLGLASRYERYQARTDAGDLSSVSADLVDEAELRRMQAEADRKVGATGAGKLALGIGVLLAALAQVAGGVLLLLRRARAVTLVAATLGAAAMGATLALDGVHTVAVVALCLSVAGLVLAALFGRRRGASVASNK